MVFFGLFFQNGSSDFFVFYMIIEDNEAHHLKQTAIFRKLTKGK